MKQYKTIVASTSDPDVVIDQSVPDGEVCMRIEDYLKALSKDGWSVDGLTATGFENGYANEMTYLLSKEDDIENLA